MLRTLSAAPVRALWLTSTHRAHLESNPAPLTGRLDIQMKSQPDRRLIMRATRWLVIAGLPFASAPGAVPEGIPAKIIVTMAHSYTHDVPILRTDDLVVIQGAEPKPVLRLTALRGDQAALEMFVLIDSSCEVGSRFTELLKFLAVQPLTTSIGVAYVRDGRMEVVERPTQDRNRVLGILGPPDGGGPSNPFVALKELTETWHSDASRRAVLMISNGIDPSADSGAENASAEAAIEAAQRARVTVYALYHPSADYATSDTSKVYWGRVQLSHVAAETGGEAYLLGPDPLPSFAPFLADIADHLRNQYLLEFLAEPAAGPGGLEEVTIKAKSGSIETVAPSRTWVLGPLR